MFLALIAAAFGQPTLDPSPVDLATGAGLEGLTDIASDVEVFGIGESIHASTGLEEARFAATEFALEELGFTAVAIEISWLEARRVDAALQRCADGAGLEDLNLESNDLWDKAWQGAYRPLLERLCERNRTHPPIHVFGIDIQDTWNSRDLLEVGTTDTTLRENCFGTRFNSQKELGEWGRANNRPPPTKQNQRSCLRHLKTLQRGELTDDQTLALQSIRANQRSVWSQHVQKDIKSSYNFREEAMTAAFHAERKRLKNPRTLLLGHDGHVARSDELYHPIGARLSEDLSYANLSVDGFQVETRMGAQFDPPSPEPGSAQDQWAKVEGPAVLILHPGEPHDGTLYLDYAER
jgi:erythromycin esterase-like protein